MNYSPWQRLLTGWRRVCDAGLALTPGQFLVLCDVLQHPGQVFTTRARSLRLKLSHACVSGAQRTLADLGLVTLREAPSPAPHLHRHYPSYSAAPTQQAYRLFKLRGPLPPTPHHHP